MLSSTSTHAFRTSRTTATRTAAAILLAAALAGGTTACTKSDDKADAKASGSGAVSTPAGQESSASAPSTAKASAGTKSATGEVSDAILTEAESPSGYKPGPLSSIPPAKEPAPVVSDPKCATLLDGSLAAASTSYATRDYEMSAPVTSQPGQRATVALSGQSHPFLMQQFESQVAALRKCTTFTATEDDRKVTYAFSDLQTDKYGKDTVSFRMRRDEDGTSAYAYVALAVRGTTGISVASYAADMPPAEPAQLAKAQIAKVEKAGS